MGKTTKKIVLSKSELKVVRGNIATAHDDNQSKMMRHALYKTNDLEVSQDLVQKTFLKTLVYLQKGGKIDLMRSFLNHVLNDLIVDEYRSKKNKVMSLDTLLENGFDPGSSDLDRHINFLDGEKMISLVPKLPKKYQTVIRLRYIKGLSLKEIALINEQSENTVAVQAHRGLKKLKELYVESTST